MKPLDVTEEQGPKPHNRIPHPPQIADSCLLKKNRKALGVAEKQCGPKAQLVAKIRLALAAATNAAQARDAPSGDTTPCRMTV